LHDFNMQRISKTMTPVQPGRPAAFEQDEQGRLYDHRFRALLARGQRVRGGNLAFIEALAAVRRAGHGLALLTDRWAEQHGLSEGRMQVLFVLRRSREHRVALGEIAGMLHVTARNVTGLVDALERDGLVRRVPDPADRRSIQAELTPAGLAKLDQIWRESFLRQVGIMSDFTEEEAADLRHLCLRIVRNMEKLGVVHGGKTP
jgi:DNA-binding MarR family transcriptional regulator